MSRKHNNKKKGSRKNKQTRTKIESRVAQFLTDLGLKYKHNHKLDKYSVDFLVESKYIIECYGDFWHCNPTKYEPEFYNRGLKCLASDRWSKDEFRKKELESMGFTFLALWENEINNNPKYCKSKIRKHLGGVEIM